MKKKGLVLVCVVVKFIQNNYSKSINHDLYSICTRHNVKNSYFADHPIEINRTGSQMSQSMIVWNALFKGQKKELDEI